MKIHIDINTYEFIEVEKEGEFSVEEVIRFHEKYHKLIEKIQKEKADKLIHQKDYKDNKLNSL